MHALSGYQLALSCIDLCTTGVWEYIEESRRQVCDLETRVRLAKANVEAIETIMAGWCQAPLYQRRDDKKDCLLNLEVSHHERLHMYMHTHGYLSLKSVLDSIPISHLV